MCRLLSNAPDTSGVDVQSSAWIDSADAASDRWARRIFSQTVSRGEKIISLSYMANKGKCLTKMVQRTPSLINYIDSDVKELRGVNASYTRYSGRWWSFLFKDYRTAKKRVSEIFEMPDKFTYQEAVRQIDETITFLDMYDNLVSYEPILKEIVSDYSDPITLDWDMIDDVYKYLTRLRSSENFHLMKDVDISSQLFATALESKPLMRGIQENIQELERVYSAIISELQVDHCNDLSFADRASQTLEGFQELVSDWCSNLEENWIFIANFNGQAALLKEEGLGDVVEYARDWNPPAVSPVYRVKYLRYESLVEVAFNERSALRGFDTSRHERTVKRFYKNDKDLLNRTKQSVAYQHWSQMPRSVAYGQMGFLRTQMSKKRNIPSIRRLLGHAGKAVQAVKPIFMMSPLSVATYLAPGSVEFDMVVFDEASQVEPVDAFGAILRGKSTVVVGDSKQLPPTSFFRRISEENDFDDDQTSISDIESVLKLFASKGANQRTLQWHYRSEHESLIAVSNKEFYSDQLLVAPSPDTRMTELGIQFLHLPDTHYESGARKAINIGEAREVAKAVICHARNNEDLSLGVVAFSRSQANVIDDEIERLRRQEGWNNDSFFSMHTEEPFFVKNLENVQGDERDVIFISVGYGRQADGVLRMNFGPLNNKGGEHRLNVLITRAKRRCVVFSNITSGDIDLSKTNALGVHALKVYLEFAETGQLESPKPTGMSADSPFEEWVARELRSRGYHVHEQVGTGQYRIDLAVVDDKKPGHYLLGIECDGASYHSSKTARDRDRIRQDTLESNGWKIHRIWSTDWFYSPKEEMDRLVRVIEDTKTDRDSNVKHVNSIGNHTRAVTIQRKKPSEGVGNVSSVPYKLWNSEERTHMPIRSYNSRLSSEYSGMVFYYETEMIDVVRVEGPIHISEVRKRISDATGERITARDDDMVRSYAERSKKLGIKDDFLYMSGSNSTVVRDRSELSSRSKNIDLIAAEEIQLAIRQVIKESIGIHVDELPRAVCSMLGLGSTTEKRRKAIFEHLELMKRRKRVVESNGVLELVSRGR